MKLLLLVCAVLIIKIESLKLDNFQTITNEVNSQQTTWQAENYYAAHITPISFKKLLGIRKVVVKLPLAEKHRLGSTEIPGDFDSRKHWARCKTIGHIQDQGNCAAGWAVAAASAFSDRICIAKNGTFRVQLSSEQLLACCDEGTGCESGSPEAAWEFFQTNGIVSGGDYKSNEGCQPYEVEPCDHRGKKQDLPDCSSMPRRKTPRCVRRCTNRSYEGRYSVDHHKTSSSFSMGNDVVGIQKEIYSRGPVEAVMYIFADFPTYKSGVYHYVAGEYLGDHAVRIIGWGRENGTDYWIAANSWNKQWGEDGFFRIKRGGNECGIESYITGGIPEV